MWRTKIWTGVSIIALLLWPEVAQAYIGPGAGLSAIGSLLSLLGFVLLLVVGFVYYPIKRCIKMLRLASKPAARPSQKLEKEEGTR